MASMMAMGSFKTFRTDRLERFKNSAIYVGEAREIGSFSLDIKRNYEDNRGRLRKFVSSIADDPKFDLNEGFDEFIYEDIQENLDSILRWIVLERSKQTTFTTPRRIDSLKTDFVTMRRSITNIMCAPYEKRKPWRLDACKYKGTIFIYGVNLEESGMTEMQMRGMYRGYKFEDYMTQSFPGKRLPAAHFSSKGSINNCEAFYSVIQTKVKEHSLLFRAEIDCCTVGDGKLPPKNYVELKTARIKAGPYGLQQFFYNQKFKYFWAQSYLAGVPKIVCGMRDDNGIVRKIETYNTLDLPRIASEAGAKWDATVCMNFCDEFLQWMKEVILVDDHRVVYSFRYEEPFDEVRVERLPYGEGSFLPDWFLKH